MHEGGIISFVDSTKKQIRKVLELNPQLQMLVSKTLLALLQIRDTPAYTFNSISITYEMIEQAGVSEPKTEEENILYIALSDLANSAAVFEDYSNEEIKDLYEYVQALIPKKDDSLEDYLYNALKRIVIKRGIRQEPNSFWGNQQKIVVAFSAAASSKNRIEDFRLDITAKIPNKRLKKIVSSYFRDRGYSIKIISATGTLNFLTEREKDYLSTTISNYPDMILVTVSRL